MVAENNKQLSSSKLGFFTSRSTARVTLGQVLSIATGIALGLKSTKVTAYD